MRSPRFLLLSAALLAAGCGGDDKNDGGGGGGVTPIPYADDGKLQVMTRNLYLGADLTPVLAATDATSFVLATTRVWARVQANNAPATPGGPPARLVAIAQEIADAKPDLVGLQEVSLWRTQTPGDAAAGGSVQATTVVYDYLAILISELAARGLDYDAAKEVVLMDLEAPTLAGASTVDVRLTDRDVILARRGVPIANPRGDAFSPAALGTVQVVGQPPFGVQRGWGAVDATIAGKQITFANTHLEAFPLTSQRGPARQAQANELIVALEGAAGPVVLVGDMNAEPTVSGDAHDILLTTGGFSDAWDAVGSGLGFTCCFAGPESDPDSLSDATATLDSRIDDVLLRPGSGTLTPERMDVIGETVAERTANGLWPSDHAGAIATIAP